MNRYNFLNYFLLIFLSVSLISRSVLLIDSWTLIDRDIFSIIQIFTLGLFYDIVAYSYYIIPFVVYLFVVPSRLFNTKTHKIIALLIFFSVIYSIVFNAISEWFFWEEFGKRFNFIAVDYLVYTHEVIQNIRESYPIPWLLAIVFALTSLIFGIISRKSAQFSSFFNDNSSYTHRLIMSIILLTIPLVFFNTLHKQTLITHISENRYNQELSKNGFYSLFSAFRNNELDYDEFYITKETNALLTSYRNLVQTKNSQFISNDLNHTLRNISNKGQEKKYNVMLVMIESLSASYMGIYGDTKNITPHIDALSKKSLFFSEFFATGTRTVRGMEAVTMSIPPTPGRSIVKRPDNHNMFGLGWIFHEKGYDNKFIYAGHGYFDNMNAYFGNNGFKIVDRQNFAKEEISFANVWGVCDEDLYNKSIKEADDSYHKDQPFFSFVMTTSNHRPFTYPEGKIDIPSHTGRWGGVKYTDYAVHNFLEKASKKPWFENTLFIFVADHNGGSAGKNDLPLYRYKIPFLIYAPKLIKAQKITKLSSQIDLAPTLLALLNWDYQSKFYGKNILSKHFKPRALIGTYQKLGLYQNNKLTMLLPNGTSKAYKVKELGLHHNTYEEIIPLAQDLEDTIDYYQSASYFHTQGLDRYEHITSSPQKLQSLPIERR
ncbi:MAG: sulfatase-like hydrolase/transferase [Sulfurovum sp.]|nr:sulfatase-like hydrolase/transferase [Sulfurovum sp.]